MLKIVNKWLNFINYKFSIKELYFSLTTWFLCLILFIGVTVNFSSFLLILNIILSLYIFLSLVFLLNRILLSGFITLLFAVLFDYIKITKWQFLMQDFVAADFTMLQLLVNHGLFRLIYEYSTTKSYLLIIVLVINFILMWNKNDVLFKIKNNKKQYYSFRSFCITIILFINILLGYFLLNPNSYLSAIIQSIEPKQENSIRKFNGPFGDILFSLRKAKTKALYNKDADINLILSEVNKYKLEQKAKNLNQFDKLDHQDNNDKDNNDDLPDIIVILNESIFNPEYLDYDFADNFDYPFFNKNQYTKFTGILNVNTFGGSSWISEYEVNTGIAHKNFSGSSYMPFLSLAPHTKTSIISYLRNMGYHTEVVYPVDKNFSTAKEAYEAMSIHKITDIYEFGFKPQGWNKVPDSMIHKMIFTTLENEPNKPKYIFASTMLNHGPHSNFQDDKIGCIDQMNHQLCSKLNDYINRLNIASKEQMNFINTLMKRKKKTIIVNFGDHMPSFEGFSTQLRFKRKINNYFKTFYTINANFDIKDLGLKNKQYNTLDINFIPSLILDIIGINNDDFYIASSIMRDKFNGSLKNNDANSKLIKSPEINKLIESYNALIAKQVNID